MYWFTYDTKFAHLILRMNCIIVTAIFGTHNRHIKYILFNVKTIGTKYNTIQYILIIINNGIIMENTAFNGTVTKDHEDWKKKKGYGPIVVAASLTFLLGLSFYAGSHSVGGNLRHGEMGMKNAAASSSSTSLLAAASFGSRVFCDKNGCYNMDKYETVVAASLSSGLGKEIAGGKCSDHTDCPSGAQCLSYRCY